MKFVDLDVFGPEFVLVLRLLVLNFDLLFDKFVPLRDDFLSFFPRLFVCNLDLVLNVLDLLCQILTLQLLL